MKKLAVVLLGVCFILTNLTLAHAWLWGKKKSEAPAVTEQASSGPAAAEKPKPAEKAKPAAAPVSDKARDEALKAKRAAAQKKLNELNNTEWSVEMSSLAAKGKKEADTITFRNNQVSIASYVKRGFPTTNFTLTVQEDGVVVWETMQTSEKSGIAFWRGEFDPKMENMRGVVSYQADKKTKQDYSFASTVKKNIPATAAGK